MENKVQTMGMVLELTPYQSDNSLGNSSILPTLLAIFFWAVVRKHWLTGILGSCQKTLAKYLSI